MRLKVTSERMEDEGRVLVYLLSYLPGFAPCLFRVFRVFSVLILLNIDISQN